MTFRAALILGLSLLLMGQNPTTSDLCGMLNPTGGGAGTLITARHAGTGQLWRTRVDAKGHFQFLGLLPGEYEIVESTRKVRLRLILGQVHWLNLPEAFGTVEVSATATSLNTGLAREVMGFLRVRFTSRGILEGALIEKWVQG